MRWIERLVDTLPRRLWKPGNLDRLPGGEWHFCIGAHPGLGRNVRTIEWRGCEIARGREPVAGDVH